MVRPFQGGVLRLNFPATSLTRENHHASRCMRVPDETWEKATKNSSSRCLSPRCGVYSLESPGTAQRAQIRDASRGKRGHWPIKLRSLLEMHVGAEINSGDLRPSYRCPQLRSSRCDKRRTQRYMLRPPDWTIPRDKILHPFPNPQRALAQFDGALEINLGERKMSLCYQGSVTFSDLVRNYGTFSMHGQPGEDSSWTAHRKNRGTDCGP